MKLRLLKNLPPLFVLSFAALATSTASATSWYWDADGATSATTGETGNWTPAGVNWRNGTATGTLTAYNNAAGPQNDPTADLVLAGADGATMTLTASTAYNLNKITASNNYTLATNTATPTFVGATPTVDVASGKTLTWGVDLAGGNATVAKTGAGAWTFNNTGGQVTSANTTLDIQAGTLRFDTSAANANLFTGAAGIVKVGSGAIVSLQQTNSGAYTSIKDWSLGSKLILNGGSLQGGSTNGGQFQRLTSTTAVQVDAASTISQANGGFSQNFVIEGAFTGTGALTLTRAASNNRYLTMKGNMTAYSGNVTLSATTATGYYLFSSPTGWGSGSLTLGGAGSTAVIGDEAASIYQGPWTGGSALAFTSGTLATNATTGLITVNALGNLQLNNAAGYAVMLEPRAGMSINGGTLSLKGTAGTSAFVPYTSTTWTFGGSALSTVSGNVKLDYAGAIFQVADAVGSGADALISGTISGTNGFTKSGLGTLQLGAENTFTGQLNILDGDVLFNNATAPAGVVGGLSGGGTINIKGTAPATLSGPSSTYTGTVNVADGATLAGEADTAGPLILGTTAGAKLQPDASTPTDAYIATDITLNGVTRVVFPTPPAPGTYTLLKYTGGLTGNATNLSADFRGSVLNMGSGTNSAITLTLGTPLALAWNNGATTSVWDTNGDTNWTAGAGNDRFYTSDPVTFDDTPGSSQIINISENVTPGSVTFNNSVAVNYQFSGSPIIGETSLVKNGTGSVTLGSANTYTGGTTLNAGTLRVGSATALSTGALSITGGTLSNSTASALTVANPITLGGDATLGLVTDTGALTLSGPFALPASRQLTVDAPVTISSAISGIFPLTKAGSGTLTLTGANAYGSTIVDTGTLQIGAGGTAGVLPAGATVNTTGTLRYFRSDSPTLANVFSGAGTLAFKGTGTSGQSSYTLTGANTLSGTLIAEAGARIGADNSAGTRFGTAAVQIQPGGQAYLSAGTAANNFSIAGNGWTESAGQLGAIRVNGTITGSVTLTAAARLASYSGSGTISGALIGSSDLEINAPTASFTGTLTYSGNGSGYTGNATVSQGTLNLTGSLGGNVSVSTSTIATLAGEGTIAGNLSLGGSGAIGSNLTINPLTAGALTSAGPLSVVNTTAVSFSPTPTGGGTYAVLKHGGTTATPANFVLAGAANYRSAPVFDTTTDPTTVTVQVASSAIAWKGTTAVWDLNTTANWVSPGPVAEKFFTLDTVTFDDTATTFAPTLAVTVNPGSVTFNNTANAYSLTGAGVIAGGGTLTKNGAGNVTLSTPNTFSGGSFLNAGKVLVGNNAAFGTGLLTLANGSAIAVDATTARTVANPLSTSGSITLGSAADTVALTLSGAGTLTGNTTFNVPSGNAVGQVISGSITDGAGSFSITKEGATGILALNGASTYDGGTVINGGRLQAGNASAYGTGTVTINPTGQAFLTVAGPFSNAFVISGTGYVEAAGNLGAIRLTGTTLSGPITLAADARISAYTSNGTLSGAISETGGARNLELGGIFTTTSGGGTITVSGTNTHSGGTSINNAIVIPTNSAAFGTGPVTLNGPTANGRIQLGNGVTVNNSLTTGGNVGATGRGILEVTGTNTATWSGPINITSGVAGGGHIYTDSGAVLNLTGPITSSVPVVHRFGTLVLSGGGNYATLSVTGLVKLAATNGIATNAEVQLGVSETASLDLNGFDQTVSSVTRTGFTTFVRNNGAVPSALTVNYSGASPSTFSGVMQDGTSTLSLTKSGTGSYVLTGANTYTGTTTISGGTLQIGGAGTTGAIAAASPIVNNASLAFNFTNAQTISSAISGSGSVSQVGTGTTTLGGALSYTGDTIVTAGTLSLSTDSLANGADVRITSGATLNLNHSLTDTVRYLYINGVVQPGGTYGSLTSSATNRIASITGNGILSVSTFVGYATWAIDNAGGQLADLDFDDDGVRNGVEYFMGQTGSSFTANPNAVNGVVTWPKDPTAIATGIVQISDDLVLWIPAPSGVVETSTSISYTLPPGASKRFVRLKVTVP